jgi:hypothetical protein
VVQVKSSLILRPVFVPAVAKVSGPFHDVIAKLEKGLSPTDKGMTTSR